MKKLILILGLFIFCNVATAQIELNYGIKTSLNYNSNGDLLITGGIAGFNESVDNESDFGYSFGIYTQLNFTKLYIRPELIYSKTKSTYSNILSPSEFKISTLELPVLVGYTIIKPVNVYVGPSLQYILNTDFSNLFDLKLDKDLIPIFNIGVAIQLNKFEIDLRYSKGLSKNLAVCFDDIPADGLGYSIDSKPSQLTLSFSYQLN